MPWKEIDIEELATTLGVDPIEVREKQKLIALIIKKRKESKLSQTGLAKKIGVSQARVAQIESGVGTSKISFDILFNTLLALGCEFKIIVRKAA